MVRFLILFVSCLCISPGSSQVFGAGKRAVTPQSVEAFFDVAFETQKLDHELLGVTVSVVKDGEFVLKKGYGFADLERRIPWIRTSIFFALPLSARHLPGPPFSRSIM